MTRPIFKIALAQMHPENLKTEQNLEKALALIAQAADQKASLVCLPELFYSGYFLNSFQMQNAAEPQNGPMAQALCAAAKAHGIYIIAGYAEADPLIGRIYNSALFISDSGEIIGNQRKNYLWKNEKKIFRGGDKFEVFDTPLGKIGILLCYDAEFPEPARIMALKGAELLLVPAAWSADGLIRWNLDLPAHALFNLVFVAGANIVDENCCGASLAAAPGGELLGQLSQTEEGILVCDVDLNQIAVMRQKIPYLNDFKEDTFSMDALEQY